ncbi:MAG: hypothetical protein SynsKO_17090 [Synoicihabitans sp.]
MGLIPMMKSSLGLFLVSALVAGTSDFIHIPEPARTGKETYWRQPGEYPANPDLERHEGVPHGTLEVFQWNESAIYPGTTRNYWIYTPAQYDSTRPAAVMVFQDGQSFLRENRPLRAPAVMDVLIAEGEMPVTIGVFVDPGQRPARADEGPAPPNPNLPLNRRIEYDTPDERYVTFLADEILPQVRAHRNVSADPANWAIAGNSSGGIAAFNAAWHRPDLFGKVAVHNATFVDLLGGDVVPQWVRETPRKPLRVALASGPYDLSNNYGVWWDTNRAMANALEDRDYDYRAVWSDNPHNPNFAGFLLSDTLRWLWRDHPEVLATEPRVRPADDPVLVQIPAPPRPTEYYPQPSAYERQPDHYPRHPDTIPRDGNPRGRMEKISWNESAVYPGTSRSIWIYVPAQYDAAHHAAVMVFQDGQDWIETDGDFRAPIVFDNLISSGDMPVTIGIFIEPADYAPDRQVIPAPIGPKPAQPANRRDEYDNIDDRYARFLLEEILPMVGERYPLSDRPEDRVLAGNSSGASAAFNAAWHRPDAFGNVIAHIGGFAAIRSAHHSPQLVRDSNPRPLRIFLQSGVNDQISGFENGWQANKALAAELQAQRYDLKTVWGDGGHTTQHAGAIFPDTLRWIWRDHAERTTR